MSIFGDASDGKGEERGGSGVKNVFFPVLLPSLSVFLIGWKYAAVGIVEANHIVIDTYRPQRRDMLTKRDTVSYREDFQEPVIKYHDKSLYITAISCKQSAL